MPGIYLMNSDGSGKTRMRSKDHFPGEVVVTWSEIGDKSLNGREDTQSCRLVAANIRDDLTTVVDPTRS